MPRSTCATMDELVALSKAKAGTLSYTAPSLPLALYLERLKRERGADWVRVPFKGGGDAVNAVLSGSTPIAFIGMRNLMAHLQAGTMTGLAVESAQRSPLFPDIPTLAELGYRGDLTRAYFGAGRAGGHAEGDRPQDPRGSRPHRQRARLPREEFRATRPRAGVEHAGGIRALPQQDREIAGRIVRESVITRNSSTAVAIAGAGPKSPAAAAGRTGAWGRGGSCRFRSQSADRDG